MDNNVRRPLKVRSNGLAQKAAAFLSKKNITPNQISIASIFFAALAAACFLLLGSSNDQTQGQAWWLLIIAAVAIQGRLLCNLFDGMVAVEGGKSTPSGELFNDIPDRIADPLLLVSAGYAISVVNWGADLGWCAGLLAVMTAYIRTLSSSIGAPISFQGPMAKQHRMALLTIACLITALETTFWNSDYSLLLVLLIIVVGSIITSIRRAISAYQSLEA